MGLRNILLVISIIIIGLCLSLYFQTNQNIQSVNLDQYQNLQYNEERSHSLEDLNTKITPFVLQNILREIVERNVLAGEKTRVMEIGAGNGRVLMELKKLFPQVEFYGINKEKTHTFYRRESYILTALKFGILNKMEIEQIELPYIIFQDVDFGTSIPYNDNKFDIVFSQGTLPYIKYKFELFNEVMRILKPGGISFHTDVNNLNVYSKGIVLDLKDALAEIRRTGIDIKTLEDPTTIRFRKTNTSILFPVTPHQQIPDNLNNLSQELRRQDMGYNIVY